MDILKHSKIRMYHEQIYAIYLKILGEMYKCLERKNLPILT